VGSKLMEGAEDKRSPVRHLISYGFTTILRALFDPRMDDTHGMKGCGARWSRSTPLRP